MEKLTPEQIQVMAILKDIILNKNNSTYIYRTAEKKLTELIEKA